MIRGELNCLCKGKLSDAPYVATASLSLCVIALGFQFSPYQPRFSVNEWSAVA
jgi:hypothetical protein